MGKALGLLLCGLILSVLIASGCLTRTTVQKYELYALKDTTKIEGSFFLASGSFGSSMVYVFYYKTDDGGIRMGMIDYYDAVIYEVTTAHPYVLFTIRRELEVSRTASFYIPPGSVLNEYKLDLEDTPG